MTAFPFVTLCGHAAHGRGRRRYITCEPHDADEGVRRRVRGHLHDCTRGILSGRWAASLGNLAHTAGYHEVRTANEDGDDGGGNSEDWQQCGDVPKASILAVVDSVGHISTSDQRK